MIRNLPLFVDSTAGFPNINADTSSMNKTPVFIATTHTARSNARSGIQAVTRGLVRGMTSLHDVPLVAWNNRRNCLHPLKPAWIAHVTDNAVPKKIFLPLASLANPAHWTAWLSSMGRNHRCPIHLQPEYRDVLPGAWLLLPEQMDGDVTRRSTAYARRHGMKIAAVFHDAIPLLRPDLTERTPEAHQDYIDALGETDLVIPTSNFSAEGFRQFAKNGHAAKIRVVSLPAEIDGLDRCVPPPSDTCVIKILCVSTLEPRKNHRTLIEAFNRACAARPDLPMELHLAGDTFNAAPEITEFVIRAAAQNPGIIWHQRTLPEPLRALYRECDFTVYPSFLEGFGMPVMESVWCGRPCLCANTGVMAENAASGGCLTTDVLDVQKLSDSLLLLASDAALRAKLTREAAERPLKSWKDYAAEIMPLLL